MLLQALLFSLYTIELYLFVVFQLLEKIAPQTNRVCFARLKLSLLYNNLIYFFIYLFIYFTLF